MALKMTAWDIPVVKCALIIGGFQSSTGNISYSQSTGRN
jgi:hypothetical protein